MVSTRVRPSRLQKQRENPRSTRQMQRNRDDKAEQSEQAHARHAQDDKETDVLLRRRMGDLHDDSVPNMADPGAGMEKKGVGVSRQLNSRGHQHTMQASRRPRHVTPDDAAVHESCHSATILRPDDPT